MCEQDMNCLIAILIVTCFSDSVHVFGGCGDSYLVDMETKIVAKWKRTFSLSTLESLHDAEESGERKTE